MNKHIKTALKVVAGIVFFILAWSLSLWMTDTDPRVILAISHLDRISDSLEDASNCEEAAFAASNSNDHLDEYINVMNELRAMNDDLLNDLLQADLRVTGILDDIKAICPVEPRPLALLRQKIEDNSKFLWAFADLLRAE